MFKWYGALVSQIEVLEKKIKDMGGYHQVCKKCGIIGHVEDMKPVSNSWDYRLISYYHNVCYAEEFNMHLCPNKCGKWLPNKKQGGDKK